MDSFPSQCKFINLQFVSYFARGIFRLYIFHKSYIVVSCVKDLELDHRGQKQVEHMIILCLILQALDRFSRTQYLICEYTFFNISYTRAKAKFMIDFAITICKPNAQTSVLCLMWHSHVEFVVGYHIDNIDTDILSLIHLQILMKFTSFSQ